MGGWVGVKLGGISVYRDIIAISSEQYAISRGTGISLIAVYTRYFRYTGFYRFINQQQQRCSIE